MNLKHLLFFGAALCAASCSQLHPTGDGNLTRYVDPKIGTGGHGHVFVGANVPFGMVQVGPTSIPQSWDWVSGYHESDSTVIGFSHTHLSGTGIGDLFDVTLMPVTGEVTYARGTQDDPKSGLWSYADRSKEVVKPGYYSVPLTRYGIGVELTATTRVGLHRYTFPEAKDAAVVFDMENGGCWDKATETHLEALNDSCVVGYRYSSGWAKDQRVYFVAEFSKPFASFEQVGEHYGRASFATTKGEQLLVKVAISPVSIEGAKLNLAAEMPDWDFENVAAAADTVWNAELKKVLIETPDETAKKTFYTALYHTMIAPSVFCDANGDYYGSDHQIHHSDSFINYTTFSLWDTYRAAHPLMTLLHPERMADIINTMLAIRDEQGRLPVWHLWGNETDCMVGNPGICVVADAITKGIEGFDKERAFEAIRTTAMDDGRGGDLRKKYGYIPCDLFEQESVAFDMEYAIADGAAAAAAKALGKQADYDYFTERSHSYRHYFDPTVGFVRGCDSKGVFRTPFSPFASSHRADDFCEGNAWQYTWLAPQDVAGLEELFGGREQMLSKLDSLFTVSSHLEGEASPDISGLIGQYAHGNEPSHHILYLYTMLGEPAKTAERVREVLTTLYHAAPDGLSGNEDVGQMSAWYVLSSLGMYQVEPAGGRYWFGSPLFDKAQIAVKGGQFVIEAHNNSAENKYIQSVTLNGQPYTNPYIDYCDIVAGGTLVFEMGAQPVAQND